VVGLREEFELEYRYSNSHKLDLLDDDNTFNIRIDVALMLLRLLLICVLFFYLMCINTLPASASWLSSPKQIGRALVNYLAATEYVHSHYNIPFYFGQEIREEDTFDDRLGVFDDKDGAIVQASLDKCGFGLFRDGADPSYQFFGYEPSPLLLFARAPFFDPQST
jgi:hypothetical protein